MLKWIKTSEVSGGEVKKTRMDTLLSFIDKDSVNPELVEDLAFGVPQS